MLKEVQRTLAKHGWNSFRWDNKGLNGKAIVSQELNESCFYVPVV